MPRFDISTIMNSDSESDAEEDNHAVRNQALIAIQANRVDAMYRAIRDQAFETCTPIGEYTNHTNIAYFLARLDTKN